MRSWSRVAASARAMAAHASLFCFTLLIALKIDGRVSYSWWLMFAPLWLFHAVTARNRFSLPAPTLHQDHHWAPCHSVVATPLLFAFELLLCIHLESRYVRGEPAVNLKIVFFPLISLEVIILSDNFRMCRALMPADEERKSDEVIRETLPHFWIAICMIFLLSATIFTLLKLCGHGALEWWDLFINFGIAECFAFLVCTKWSNPLIHQQSQGLEPASFSTAVGRHDMNSGLVMSAVPDASQEGSYSFHHIGGHFMKVPLIIFQVLLCMYLERTPPGIEGIPILGLFLPLFVLQGAGVLFAIFIVMENLAILLHDGPITGRCTISFSRAHECFTYLYHGSRLLGWWSIDEGSKEERAFLLYSRNTGYNTFFGHPPEEVKKLPKKDLVEEIWRLEAALREQTRVTKHSQQEFEKLQFEKIRCRVCYEAEICMVLLPCRHRTLCMSCSEKCKRCPICRARIEERMPVYTA